MYVQASGITLPPKFCILFVLSSAKDPSPVFLYTKKPHQHYIPKEMLFSRHRNSCFGSHRGHFSIPGSILVKVPVGSIASGGRSPHPPLLSRNISDPSALPWSGCSVSPLSQPSVIFPRQRNDLSRSLFALWLEAAYWSVGFCSSAACISHYSTVTFYISGLFIFCFSLQGAYGNVLNQLCFWRNHIVESNLGMCPSAVMFFCPSLRCLW